MKLRIFILPLLLLLAAAAATVNAQHNIMSILAKHPQYSSFRHYLNTTRLAAEINRRRTITVCVVTNAAMNDLIAQHFPLDIMKNILSLHVFADYFSAKKLHQIPKGSTLTSSLFQATGEAAGTSGYVKITDTGKGKVIFTPTDTDSDESSATFVKSVEEIPYVISVIEISKILQSPSAESPVAAPTDINLISLLARQGCKAFSDALTAQGADDVFTESIKEGLTIFCPSDDALKSFAPSYKNLTADGKTSLLLYHGVPVYNSMDMLRSGKSMSTLATEGAKKFDFTVKIDGDDVKLDTKVVAAVIDGTVIDKDPLAVYKIDRVLLPKELFKTAPATATPKSKAGEEAESPGPAADDEVPADENSSNDGGRLLGGGGFLALIVVGLVIGVTF